MRLTCPNCGAQYEVPDDIIPETGRDVQCSNCGNTWFENPYESAEEVGGVEIQPAPPAPEPEPQPEPQPEPETVDAAPEEEDDVIASVLSIETDESDEHYEFEDPEIEDEEEDDEEESVAPADFHDYSEDDDSYDDTDDEPIGVMPARIRPARPARTIDPAIASILREEADLAASRRVHEPDPIESQPDLGLDDLSEAPELDPEERHSLEVQRRLSTLKGEEQAIDGPRKDLLPDIEEINSTLRSAADRVVPAGDKVEQENRSGFRTGFLGTIVAAGIAAAGYIYGDAIGDMVPAVAAPLDSYSTWVDGLRVSLNSAVEGFVSSQSSDG